LKWGTPVAIGCGVPIDAVLGFVVLFGSADANACRPAPQQPWTRPFATVKVRLSCQITGSICRDPVLEVTPDDKTSPPWTVTLSAHVNSGQVHATKGRLTIVDGLSGSVTVHEPSGRPRSASVASLVSKDEQAKIPSSTCGMAWFASSSLDPSNEDLLRLKVDLGGPWRSSSPTPNAAVEFSIALDTLQVRRL